MELGRGLESLWLPGGGGLGGFCVKNRGVVGIGATADGATWLRLGAPSRKEIGVTGGGERRKKSRCSRRDHAGKPFIIHESAEACSAGCGTTSILEGQGKVGLVRTYGSPRIKRKGRSKKTKKNKKGGCGLKREGAAN